VFKKRALRWNQPAGNQQERKAEANLENGGLGRRKKKDGRTWSKVKTLAGNHSTPSSTAAAMDATTTTTTTTTTNKSLNTALLKFTRTEREV
jgi:hypothetical protein